MSVYGEKPIFFNKINKDWMYRTRATPLPLSLRPITSTLHLILIFNFLRHGITNFKTD